MRRGEHGIAEEQIACVEEQIDDLEEEYINYNIVVLVIKRYNDAKLRKQVKICAS